MTSLFAWIIVLVIGTVAAGCERCKPTKSNANCTCIEIYDPVCGCDGKTYGNSCQADCVGVTYEKGECK